MSQITKKVLETIEEKQLTPKPRWRFSLRNIILWLLCLFSIILGALAMSTIFFMLTEHDWDIHDYLNRSHLKHLLISIPYFWVLVIVLFLLFAYFDFRRTKKGYRYGALLVILISVIGSAVLGAILFCGRIMDSEVHELFSQNIPYYNDLIYFKEDIWIYPDKGLLGGKVEDIKNESEFIIKDLNGTIWHVKGENIKTPEDFILFRGEKIKMIGQRGDDNIFNVRVIRLWCYRCNQ